MQVLPMLNSTVRELLNPLRADIIELLKVSNGLPVRDIADTLGSSYMGVKQHCQALVKLGLAKKWRIPRGNAAGRPQIRYQLTAKADDLFPDATVELTLAVLAAATKDLGPSGPEKLLFRYFADLRERWGKKMRGAKSLVEKCTLLTDLRKQHGVISKCEFDPEMGFRIEEYHNAMDEIFVTYPTARAMETRMLSDLVGTTVRREELVLDRGRSISVLVVNTL